MVGIPIALAVSNVGEWFFHKHVLHGMGKRKKSLWSFHWHEHHKLSRKNGMYDGAYVRPLTEWNGQTKEAIALAANALIHLPLFPIAPFYTATMLFCMGNYYVKHRRAHLDVEWGRQNMPWHYDHHMGRNQDANWCVTNPWFDNLVGTRLEGPALDETPTPERLARRAAKQAA